MSRQKDYKVRAVHCDYRAGEEEVYAALKRATDPLDEAWERLGRATSICIKFNQDMLPDQVVRYEGQLQQLVSENVARATLRLLRERTGADLYAADVSVYEMYRGTKSEETATLWGLFEEFGVQFVNGTKPPYKVYDVPGGGQMFRRYLLPEQAVETDEFISVAKMKNHAFMGVTMSLKNLFGLMPGEPHGHTRHYFHHLVRMPYMLADMGRLFNPALNIVDALVSQAGREWGNGLDEGPARVTNAILAGDHTIATDACGTHLMGHDPLSDWLTPPFHRDRNSLLAAAEGGFGTVDLNEIDFESEVAAPLGAFYSDATDPFDTVLSWRRSTAEQALIYRDHRQRFVDEYAGEYILLQEGEVRWHNKFSELTQSRRQLAGDRPKLALWQKYVDPEEVEGEHYTVYERALDEVAAATVQRAAS